MTREEAIQVLSMVEAHGTLVIQAKEMAIKALEQKPICPSAGVDCEDCPVYGDAISRYQKIKQMLYELKEMPLAPCLMKGHICAVHEILNEVMEPSTSSSQKPKSEWEHDHEILKAYSDGANEVLDIIKAEIESKYESIPDTFHHYETGFTDALEWVLSIIDKYQAESEDKA